MTFNERNGISVAEIAVFIPVLVVAILLALRHGFSIHSGWFYLITFSLLRIVGAGLQLGELKDASNANLYIGAAICQNIGFSPLLLTTIGLLRRIRGSMDKKSRFVQITLLVTQLLISAALALGIVGGIDAGQNFSSTGKFTYSKLSKIAVALFVVSFVIVILAVLYTSFSIQAIGSGEKRLLLVIVLSLPILAIRLVYSCLSNFLTTQPKWNTLTGSANLLLGLEVIPEMVVAILYEAFGLSLQKRVKYGDVPLESRDVTQAPEEPHKSGGVGHFFTKYTIIGRLISRASRSGDR